jgi:hypothetical protein
MDPAAKKRSTVFSKAPRAALGPTQTPVQWVLRAVCSGVTRPSDHVLQRLKLSSATYKGILKYVRVDLYIQVGKSVFRIIEHESESSKVRGCGNIRAC